MRLIFPFSVLYLQSRDKYMHTGHGFLLVFSLTCSHSYRDVPGLHNHILQVKDTNFIPLVLVGNKADLLDEYEVSAHDAIMLAESLKVPFFKTSAKLHINVEEAFLYALCLAFLTMMQCANS